MLKIRPRPPNLPLTKLDGKLTRLNEARWRWCGAVLRQSSLVLGPSCI
jgi:hypothetical protein